MSAIKVFIPGNPQPGVSKRAFPFKRANGKLGVAVSDMNPKVGAWRQDVLYAVKAAVDATTGFPLQGPVKLEIDFVMPRPKGHYRVTKKNPEPTLRDDAPLFHTSAPDTTKLPRAVEDALKGVAWRDASQVCAQVCTKTYGELCGATLRISSIELAAAPESSRDGGLKTSGAAAGLTTSHERNH